MDEQRRLGERQKNIREYRYVDDKHCHICGGYIDIADEWAWMECIELYNIEQGLVKKPAKSQWHIKCFSGRPRDI